MSGFSFRGVHSSKFGIYTQDTSRIILPPRREGKVVIPGRSGYYDGVAGNVYDERAETIHCAFKCPKGKTVPEVYGEFDLTWNYNPPFALGRTVTQPITSGENPVDYQGTAETPCIIVLRNLSDADVLTITITAIKRSV